jgi:chemotaxis protein methyltransferase CheR
MAITGIDFNYIRKLVRERSALVLEPGKEYLVESRLDLLARREGAASIQELLARLRADESGGLQRKVVEAMITAETTFFRDVRPFDSLRRAVFPELLARRTSDRTLNLWCAATSAGQEPYSVAMMLREDFPSTVGWQVRFIASDISRELLQRAQEGRYSQLEVNRGLPAALLIKYFRKSGSEWQIHPSIRSMVEFQEINLAKPWPVLPNMDIILMRNVLIYFDTQTKKVILERARRLLNPEGYLILGGSETTVGLDDSFEPLSSDRASCFRLRESRQKVARIQRALIEH